MKKKAALLSILALAIALLTPSAALAAQTQTNSEKEVWDSNRTGSITVQKYSEDSYLTDQPNLSQTELAAYLQQHPDELTPVSGVVFRYLKVADCVQYISGNTVSIGYTVDQATVQFLGLDDQPCYDASVLADKLADKTASETETYMEGRRAQAMPATDGNGTSTVSNLELGLYLLCEYIYPGTALADTEHCAPFFVSIPSSDRESDGGSSWVYDVRVAPKNVTTPLRNDLVIVDTSGSETKEYDAEMDAPVQFRIRSDVPAAVGKLETYQITDTISSGITLDQTSISVCGIDADTDTRTRLLPGKDYTVQTHDADTVFDFKTAALAANDGWAKYDAVEIYYKAKLNETAVIGGEGNPSEVKTEYSRFANDENSALATITAHCPVRLFCYAINVHKVASDTKAGMAGVAFELRDAAGKVVPLAELSAGRYCLDTDGTDKLVTDANGDLTVLGVEATEYQLVETSTLTGYTKLSKPVKISITSNELEYRQSDTGTMIRVDSAKTYYTDIYPICRYWPTPWNSGKALDAGTYVCTGTAIVWATDVGQETMYVSEPLHWSCNYAMGGRTGVDSGIIKLEIINSKIPIAPKTGDSSHFILACIVLTGAATGLAVSKIRRNEKKC